MADATRSHGLPAKQNRDIPPQRLSTQEFIEQVQLRPAIWNKAGVDENSKKKESSAWRQLCQLTWPDFEGWTADTKRKRCLQLQQKWKKLKNSFLIEHCRRQKDTGKQENIHPKCADYEKLAFLITTTIPPDRKQNLVAKTDQSEAAKEPCSCNQDCDEDKRFLLSLLSHMQEVPRSQKLALRSEMIQLVAKYTPSTDPITPRNKTD